MVATLTSTGCESDPVTVTVGEDTSGSTATATTVDNTVCDVAIAGDYDGSIILAPNTYTYTWYQGTATAGNEILTKVPTATVANESLTEIPAGTYAAVIVNPATGCSNTQTFTIGDNLSTTDPVIAIGSVTTTGNTLRSSTIYIHIYI